MSNYIPATKYPITENDAWKSLSGELPVRMTNDYLFKALLQSDNETLKAILASLLHMPISRIKSAKIKNEILLGTKQDKKYGIDRWARLFKAETWEDMKMLAKEDKTMERAISGVWQLTEEEAIREECLKREEWLMNYNWEKEKQARTAEENKKLKERLKQKNSEIKQKDTKIAELEEELRKAKAN